MITTAIAAIAVVESAGDDDTELEATESDDEVVTGSDVVEDVASDVPDDVEVAIVEEVVEVAPEVVRLRSAVKFHVFASKVMALFTGQLCQVWVE